MTNDDAGRLPAGAKAVLQFWFEELEPEQWWRDSALDGVIRERFQALHERLANSVPPEWMATPRAALAAVIVLDQFPRNMFRGTARAFATDAKAREIARHAVDRGFDLALGKDERAFLYLPFEHSEDPADQSRSLELFRALGDAHYLKFAQEHADVIQQFGRFPQRNAALGRESTVEELAFLSGTDKKW